MLWARRYLRGRKGGDPTRTQKCTHACICTYQIGGNICINLCCRVETWSKNSFFFVKTWSNLYLFCVLCFFFQKCSSFCRKNDVFTIMNKIEDKQHHFFESELGPISLHNEPFGHFGAIFLLQNMLKPLFYSAFSKNEFFKPTPKNKEHYL